MIFRKSDEKDIKNIMKIICKAQKYFKENNIDQWQNGYPNEDSIKGDISFGESYILCNEEGKVIATCAVSFRGEKNYLVIEKGQWKSNVPYAVVHRIAVDDEMKGQGLSSIMMKKVEEICLSKGVESIRIDTHADNKSMQRLILKNNFEYCGIIHVADGSERFAYEKLL